MNRIELYSSQMRMLRSAKSLLILLVLSSVSPLLADDSVEAALNRLSTVEKFAFGGVGWAGVISKGETDFRFVLAQPESTALNAFERLYATGNPQGKSYALAGLQKLAPQRFTELVAALGKSTGEVEVQRGCIVFRESLPDVAEKIGRGQFRLWSNHASAPEIHEAVKNNDLAKVRKLIKNNPDLVFIKDADGITPLHFAAGDANKKMVKLLLASKADVNAKDNNGTTPLHAAATALGKRVDLLEMLIAGKADVNAADTNGLTPLHYATLVKGAKRAKVLLTHGAHPDVKDNAEGSTPLIMAAEYGYKDVAEVLLANGADVNAADKKGTPLDRAIHTGHTDVANLLRQHGGRE